MTRCWTLCFAAVVALVAAAQAAQADWVIRPVATFSDGNVYSADVLVGPSGEISVGYAEALGGGQGPIYLARVNNRMLDYTLFAGTAPSASYGADDFGGVYFAACPFDGSAIKYGQSLGMWGGVVEQALANTAGTRFGLSLAVDSHGTPAVGGPDPSLQGRASYTRFDVRTGNWVTQAVGQEGTSSWSTMFAASLCLDKLDLPALATIQQVAGGDHTPQPLILSRQLPTGNWVNCDLGLAIPASGVSLAASSAGEVGWAYVNDSGLVFASERSAACVVSSDLVSGTLSPRGLAFDPAGKAAIVCGGADGQMRLFRQDSAGAWIEELLPVAGKRGSLAFDAEGNPLIAIAGEASVTLLGGATLPAALPGDNNGDSVVDVNDLNNVFNNLGQIGFGTEGDTNADGIIDVLDLNNVFNNLGTTLPVGADAVPEPAPLSLLVLGALGLIRRARQLSPS